MGWSIWVYANKRERERETSKNELQEAQDPDDREKVLVGTRDVAFQAIGYHPEKVWESLI